jgi:hypothetical protein
MSEEKNVGYTQPNPKDLELAQQQVRNATEAHNTGAVKEYPTSDEFNFGTAYALATENSDSNLWRPFARRSWQTNGYITKFIFCQRPSVITQEIIPKMTSLPNSVKAFFHSEKTERLFYRDQICVVNMYSENRTATIQNWTATAEDLGTDDWFVLPEALSETP